MKIITRYALFFLESNSGSMVGGQIVLQRNQGEIPRMPADFFDEQAALDWLEQNARQSPGKDFVILPVHRME